MAAPLCQERPQQGVRGEVPNPVRPAGRATLHPAPMVLQGFPPTCRRPIIMGGAWALVLAFPFPIPRVRSSEVAMAYPFVAAAFDYGERHGPALAFVVHMAEGGGTVGYLATSPARGVSVHFVIQYTGRIVQMLGLDRVSGSVNPRDLRTTTDAPFTGYNGEQVRYGAASRKLVLGAWDANPNHAIITVEVEGFATRGPNVKQRVALVELYRYLVGELPTLRGILGHRDFTTRKACPGKFIPWRNMALVTGGGRHGQFTAAETARIKALHG